MTEKERQISDNEFRHIKENIDKLQNDIERKIDKATVNGFKSGYETGFHKGFELGKISVDDNSEWELGREELRTIKEFSEFCYINGIDFSYMSKASDKVPFTERVLDKYYRYKYGKKKEDYKLDVEFTKEGLKDFEPLVDIDNEMEQIGDYRLEMDFINQKLRCTIYPKDILSKEEVYNQYIIFYNEQMKLCNTPLLMCTKKQVIDAVKTVYPTVESKKCRLKNDANPDGKPIPCLVGIRWFDGNEEGLFNNKK